MAEVCPKRGRLTTAGSSLLASGGGANSFGHTLSGVVFARSIRRFRRTFDFGHHFGHRFGRVFGHRFGHTWGAAMGALGIKRATLGVACLRDAFRERIAIERLAIGADCWASGPHQKHMTPTC